MMPITLPHPKGAAIGLADCGRSLQSVPMTILIRNARVLTLTGGARPRRGAELGQLAALDHGEVLVDGGKIVAVGTALEAPAGAEIIEAHGRVLMPGFVDCHTQACWHSDLPALLEPASPGSPPPPNPSRGFSAVVDDVRQATRKQLAARLKERLGVMLREGTTTAEVKSSHGITPEAHQKMLQAIQRAAHEWPATIVPTAFLGQGNEGDPEGFSKMVTKEILAPVSHEFPGIPVEACCDRDAWTVESCVRLLERAKLRGHPLRVSADQQVTLGMISEALRLGALSVAHLDVSTKADLTLLANSHAFGVILPATSLSTGQRFARAGFFVETGGALALATNCNPVSSPGHSMPLAIALAVRFCGLTAAEAIAACTVNAATLLGLGDRGTIAPGQRADLILLRHKDERMLACEMGGNPVDLVICGGAIQR